MRQALVFLLILLPVYFALSLYYLDKEAFFCPVIYRRDFTIRMDSRGDGIFASERSGSRTHKGLDLAAQVGTPVFACRSGRVVAARQNNGMGKFIIIDHGYDFTTLYGHLSAIYVKENQLVRQGEIIGAVGKTGNANYKEMLPHLHLEIRIKGVHQNPLDYLE
ncbi:MAG TPA: M23 family metallopeptidase [Candidatus Margulisiibacteriota bacterium]|nr:M23 family metallopeptidase [Candidatus Margulisiibacteriota bacterium]